MLLMIRRSLCDRYLKGFQKVNVRSTWVNQTHSLVEMEVEKITRIINDHPFPDPPLEPTLISNIPPSIISTTFVEKVLGELSASDSNCLKAYEFFKFSLSQSQFTPSSDAFEKTLRILTKMRHFSKAWELFEKIKETHPSLMTTNAMRILLSRIAKYRSCEYTLEAFEKMEKDVFCGKKFGTEEFNVLIQAFCTQRSLHETQLMFNKMHLRFTPNVKTMNILLLRFMQSGDITSVEIFYHDMILRGFKADNETYNIRIGAYCKKGGFENALRLFEEMENAGCSPKLETIATLIRGAGWARNIGKVKQLFCEISMRGLIPDVRAYNAFISSLIRCGDVKSASSIIDDMVKKNILPDNVTYNTIFAGLIKLSKRVGDADGVLEFFLQMTERKFVPETRTVVMLMKFFCLNHMVDKGLNLWSYLLENRHCPHADALDLLVTGLCSRGKVQEAFECTKQLLERGKCPSNSVISLLGQCLPQEEKVEKIKKLEYMLKQVSTDSITSRINALS